MITIEAKEKEPGAVDMDEDFREQYGIKYIRGCEIVDFIGVDGNGFIYVYCIITLLFD